MWWILICLYFSQLFLILLQRAFAQHQAEIAKMGQFDNICAEKLDWRESLIGKYAFSLFCSRL